MLNARRARRYRAGMDDSRLMARLRLFGLLTLLVPLFVGLQYVIRDGVPRVEVRLVARDVETTVPVEVPVERIVERVVYVPVARQGTQAPDSGLAPARGRLPSTPPVDGEPRAPGGELRDVAGNVPLADVAAHEPAEAAPEVAQAAEPTADAPPLIGTVALVPPPVVAPAPARRAASIIAAAPAPPTEAEVAGDSESDETSVAVDESPASDEQAVTAAPQEGAEAEGSERVRLFVSEAPVVRDDDGPSVAMLRHELYTTVPRPAPVAAESLAEPAAEVEAAEAEAEDPVTDEQGAAESEEAVAEPEAPGEAEASPSTEELLAAAESVTAVMIDPSNNGGPAIAVIEHTLVARPAVPAQTTEVAEVAVASEVDEAAEVASQEHVGDAEAEAVAAVDHEGVDQVIVADGPATDEAPEQ